MNWTVNQRIAGGFAFGLALMVLLLAISIYANGETTSNYESALQEQTSVQMPTLEVRDAFQRANLDYLFYLVNPQERWANSMDSSFNHALTLARSLGDSATLAEDRTRWSRVIVLFARWDQAARSSMADR